LGILLIITEEKGIVIDMESIIASNKKKLQQLAHFAKKMI